MNLKNILAQTELIVLEAGKYLEKEFQNFTAGHAYLKSDNQLVSYVDIATEKMLVEKLAALVPEAGFVTEENTSEKGQAEGLNWIIDPLDGTTNFVHGLPVFSISVALYDNNTGLVGVVYDVCRNELFSAAKDMGAHLNGTKLSLHKLEKLSDSLIATGFPYYDFDGTDAYLAVLKKLMKTTHGLRRMGSAAIDLAYTSAGRFDGFFEYGLHAWDVAAGIILVKEAGGFVCDFKGDDDFLFGDTIVCGNVFLEPHLLQVIQSEFKH